MAWRNWVLAIGLYLAVMTVAVGVFRCLLGV